VTTPISSTEDAYGLYAASVLVLDMRTGTFLLPKCTGNSETTFGKSGVDMSSVHSSPPRWRCPRRRWICRWSREPVVSRLSPFDSAAAHRRFRFHRAEQSAVVCPRLYQLSPPWDLRTYLEINFELGISMCRRNNTTSIYIFIDFVDAQCSAPTLTKYNLSYRSNNNCSISRVLDWSLCFYHRTEQGNRGQQTTPAVCNRTLNYILP